jgi:hypothetical protein
VVYMSPAASTHTIGSKACRHWTYFMNCDQIEQVRVRADGHCEICQVVPKLLMIDHDATVGWWAVRGLLCVRCNTRLMDRAKTAAEHAYMERAWYRTVQIPTPEEPPVGARVSGPFAGEWVRTADRWRRTKWANCAKPLTWIGMCRKYGAHNLAVETKGTPRLI